MIKADIALPMLCLPSYLENLGSAWHVEPRKMNTRSGTTSGKNVKDYSVKLLKERKQTLIDLSRI